VHRPRLRRHLPRRRPLPIRRDTTRLALALEKSDLREKVRVRRAANLILFVVDASWSMAVAERMEATKGAIMSLLTDAYQRRDRVGLIVFNKNDANLVLPPTNSVQLAKKALADIAVGGKTPLSAGLMTWPTTSSARSPHPPRRHADDDPAHRRRGQRQPERHAAPGGSAPHRRTHAETDVRSVVINMEHAAFDQGLAKPAGRPWKSQRPLPHTGRSTPGHPVPG
jgi:hypothetical protein